MSSSSEKSYKSYKRGSSSSSDSSDYEPEPFVPVLPAYFVVGECDQYQIRGLIHEHEEQLYLNELETRLDERFTIVESEIGRFASENRGNPKKIMKRLQRVCKGMEKHGFEHMPVEELFGYAELEIACNPV